ncbi:hypothetical protein DespoDRAFT_01274 [Desulfobacter postgatei 2ac9]|uniref:Uncharacterized protein n=1 Tax=Desulfobacter postgatei 2ac9 TaxID=879212 RepID=I5B171_9BACT|nr:hypothetical protein DespoDRAFT_01274 [Desulfobacter postgatei 2ac9]
MTQVCQVCQSYNRPDIDRALIQGKSYSKLANQYDLDPQAIRNHHLNHLSRQLVQAWERKQDAESRDLLGEIDELVERTKGILDKAEKKGQLKTALAGIRELRGSYELMSRIAFSLHQAKEKDIELARIESGEADYQLEQDFREKLKVLSMPELMLFNALLDKIESQDKDRRPIGEALERKTLYMQWLESPEEYEAAFNPLGIEHIDLLEPLKVEPLEPLGLDDPPDPEPDPPMTRTKKRGPGRPPGSRNKKTDHRRSKRGRPLKVKSTT